jgi:fumarylpyruvate hydrolase
MRAPHANVVAILGSGSPFAVRRIYCVGRNYVEHIREMKEGEERDPPFFFQKPADAVVGNGATIPYPQFTEELHHEVELVVAIGGGGQSIGKSFDHSAPCGPIRISSTGAISKGSITLSVNGSGRQKGDLSKMIWNVSEIIANLSNHYELQPGDLIFTGTPADVGPIVPGDRLEGAIEGLGTLRATIGPRKV